MERSVSCRSSDWPSRALATMSSRASPRASSANIFSPRRRGLGRKAYDLRSLGSSFYSEHSFADLSLINFLMILSAPFPRLPPPRARAGREAWVLATKPLTLEIYRFMNILYCALYYSLYELINIFCWPSKLIDSIVRSFRSPNL